MSGELVGDVSVIGMRGCEDFVAKVDGYLKEWRLCDDSFIIDAKCPRFGSGEAKGLVNTSMRGHDVYIISDCFNYGVTYNMYGMEVPMSPDDHFQDLKRVIGAIGGKARRISVIMPMLYEGRQHKRSTRESLDCALALQELVNTQERSARPVACAARSGGGGWQRLRSGPHPPSGHRIRRP